MANQVGDAFIQQINENLGIAHKVARIYFQAGDDRDDVVQEMMYQLWRAYPAFDRRSKFSTWMYRVCLNTALTYKRKRKNEKIEPLLPTHHQVEDQSSAEQEESLNSLFDAITMLSPLNKAIILLYLEDMSYEEIATVIGLTKSNVSVRLVRIKKELESYLKRMN